MGRFKPYFRYLRPHRGLLALAIVCGLIYGVVYGAGLPYMIRHVFPVIFPERSADLPEKWKLEVLADKLDLSPEQVSLLRPSFAQAAIDFGRNGEESKTISQRLDAIVRPALTPGQLESYTRYDDISTWELALVVLWLPAVFVVRGVAGYCNAYLIQLIGTRVLEAIRLDLFRKLQILPLSFFHRNSTGDLLARALADANQLQTTLTNAANEIVKSPATLLGAIGYLVWLSFHVQGVALVLVTLGVIPLCVLPIRYIGKKLIARAGQIQAEFGAVANRITENLTAAKEVRSYNLEEREIQRFGLVSRALIRVQMKFVKYEKALTPLIEIISACGISFTLLYAYKVQLDKDTFLALVTALYASYEPIKKLGALNNDFKRGIGALDRLEEILEAPVTIADAPNALPLPRARGDIAFEGVHFSYQPTEPVLRNVSVHIPQGTICALIGPSGAGKSTFANIVPRFFEPVSGKVTLDGHDLRSLKLEDLRRNIAIVSQDPVLFNDTIFSNLAIARPGATRADIEAAAKNAFAHDFIQSFPEGYETTVGERGARLSGGQKQRLALARAFLRDAPILILDEHASALDAQSEQVIQEAMKKLAVGKTVLIIAHRFSTIRDASLILVFDQGEIVASGSHSQLYASSALYKALYDRQHAAA